jgi:hypothetical protein
LPEGKKLTGAHIGMVALYRLTNHQCCVAQT